MEKVCVLFVGFLCFSVGQSTSTVEPSTAETTSPNIWAETSSLSTQQSAPSVITGLRINVKSLVDLSNNSPEMELLVRQIESFIPSQHKATTSIIVRRIQKY